MAARSKKIRVGIAGLGRSGWDIHAALIGTLKSKYDVVAVFDQEDERLQEANRRFGCATYRRFRGLVHDDDVELVVVAMPTHLHARYSVAALNAGKHVVCEKPMATSLQAADRMIAAAERNDRILSVFQNRRYAQDFCQVRKVIDSGKLGRIVQIKIAHHGFRRRWDWQTLKKYGGGELNNTGPHPIDQALVLFGDREPRVFCLRDRTLTLGDADDHVKVVLHGPCAPTVEVEITAACAYGQSTWLVMGTLGSLTGSTQELKWTYFNPAKAPKREVDEGPAAGRRYQRETLPLVERSWSLTEDKGPGQEGFYLDLYQTLRHGRRLQVTPESVRRQMWVLDRCRRQAPV